MYCKLRSLSMRLLLLTLLTIGFSHHGKSQTYTWKNVRIGGGGNITSIQAHPLVRNLYFIATDVGTPYRWNHSLQSWEGLFYNRPASQWGKSSAADIAFAPGDSTGNILYATIGGPYSIDGTVLKSTDRGTTWTDCKIQLDVKPNSDQGAGQRLAVDPRNSDVVIVTTRSASAVTTTNGTFRSTNAGATGSWTKINDLYGSFVVFHPSGEITTDVTKSIYIGCKDGIYHSDDGGNTFSLMAGSPANPNRASIHKNGNLYVAAGSGVFKWDGILWSNITPPTAGNYSTVAVNPNNDLQLVCSSNSFTTYKFNAYRSANGGASWTSVETHTSQVADLSEVPWYATGLGQNINELCWDPFNQDMVWFTDFFFASQTTNIWASAVKWKPRAVGEEETVATGNLLCPPSGVNLLITSLADAGGWDHKSLSAPPTVGMQKFFPWKPDPGKSGGWGNMTGAAVQETNPNFIARVGRIAWDGSGYAGYSSNGGTTYTQFKIPEGVAGGRIAIAAASETLVWIPQTGAPQRSVNRGASWTVISSLPLGIIGGANVFASGPRFPIAADKVNGKKFYIYSIDPADNKPKFYVSSDEGNTFTVTPAVLPWSWVQDNLTVETTPGKEGDVWVGMMKSGLYHSTNSGTSFQKISQVQSADFFAVGKASPSKPTIPALYVFGKVNNIDKSLFRSDDNGATWVNLGPPAIGRDPLCMSADRQVYGRVFIGTGGNGFFVLEPDAPTFSFHAETPKKEKKVDVYPNPISQGKFNIKLTGYQAEKSVQLILTDLSGKVVHKDEIITQGLAEQSATICLPTQINGLYILSVLSRQLRKSIKVAVHSTKV